MLRVAAFFVLLALALTSAYSEATRATSAEPLGVIATAQLTTSAPPTATTPLTAAIIKPRILGGGTAMLPLKTNNEARQRYYKPSAKSDGPLSPYTRYLNDEEQAQLYKRIRGARERAVPERDIRRAADDFVRARLTPHRYLQFAREQATFVARLAAVASARRRRSASVPLRLFAKLRPRGAGVASRRQLHDLLNNPMRDVKAKWPKVDTHHSN